MLLSLSNAFASNKALVSGEISLRVNNCSTDVLDTSDYQSAYSDSKNPEDKRSLYFLSKVILKDSASGLARVSTKDTVLAANGSIKIGGVLVGNISVKTLINKAKEECATAKKERIPYPTINLEFNLKQDTPLSYKIINTHSYCSSRGAGTLDGTWTTFDLHEVYASDKSSSETKAISVNETNFTYKVSCRTAETFLAGKKATERASLNVVYHAPSFLISTSVAAITNTIGGSMSPEEASSLAREIEDFATSPAQQVAAIADLRRASLNLPLHIVEQASPKSGKQ